MSSEPQELTAGVWRFQRLTRRGFPLNMYAIRLRDGGILVHSPTYMGQDAFDQLEQLGPIRILCAPNHFHHVSLERFLQRFPEAKAVASTVAMPRLERHGHSGVEDALGTTEQLPTGARWHLCEGALTGELWLSLPGEQGPTWIVCDAFFNIAVPVPWPMRWMLRALKILPGPAIGQPFRWLALGDRAAYRQWALSLITQESPRRLLVSHGDPLVGDDLPQRLASLIHQRLG